MKMSVIFYDSSCSYRELCVTKRQTLPFISCNWIFVILNNLCFRELINAAHLHNLLFECQDSDTLSTQDSNFMWKWDNTLFWFTILCYYVALHPYFHSFALPPCVRFQNVSSLKYSWFPNFKPNFLKINIWIYYIPVLRWYTEIFVCFNGDGRSVYVWNEHMLPLKTDGESPACVLCSQSGNPEVSYNLSSSQCCSFLL
jgi:hypothetical protein